jgi:hypothetical protein
LKKTSNGPQKRINTDERIAVAKAHFINKWFSRKDYMKLFPRSSAPTMSRDLANGLAAELLRKRGEKNKTEYQFL